MVSLFIFTSSLNRKLVLTNCLHVSRFIFLANVWVEVKTSCAVLREIPARTVKSDKKMQNMLYKYQSPLWRNLLIHDTFKDFINCLTSNASVRHLH